MSNEPGYRHHVVSAHVHRPFGADSFGRRAEGFARFYGTPRFLIGQTVVVAVWILLNTAVMTLRWDADPFILLNLMFSLQAAYAAPLILLAQARQADRDKAMSDADNAHREALAAAALERQNIADEHRTQLHELLEVNTRLTKQIQQLTTQIHDKVIPQAG